MAITQGVPSAWLTQDAYDRLQAELTHLSGPGRAEIVSKIEQARQEGDLKENGGYHAAKDEQGKIEARIRQLSEMLRNAKVGEAPADDGIVEQGMLVTATVAGDEMTFLLGSREVGAEDVEVYSERSALGAAIMNKKVGEKTSYVAPNGREIAVEILAAKPYTS